MRLLRVTAGLFLFVAVASARAEVQVRLAEGKLDVTATSAPVSEVLDRIARQTGMKIVYDGAPPRSLVSVTIQGRSPVETIYGLLEGLGLNYALRTDLGGSKVDTLLLLAGSSGGPARPATNTPARPPIAAVPEPDEPDDDEAAPAPAEAEVPAGQAPAPPPNIPGAAPQPNQPPSLTPAGPQSVAPTNPAFSTSPFLSPMTFPGPVIVPQPQPAPTPTPPPTNQD